MVRQLDPLDHLLDVCDVQPPFEVDPGELKMDSGLFFLGGHKNEKVIRFVSIFFLK